MNGLEEYVSPSAVVVLVADAHEVRSLGQARAVEVLGQDALDLRVEVPVLGLKCRAVAVSGVRSHKVLGRRDGGEARGVAVASSSATPAA